MKRAVLLHGTDSGPTHNWQPWMKRALESEGLEVWAPELPNSHVPNYETYNNFLVDSGWDFHDTIMFGHSSGTTAIFNFLMDDRSPRIGVAVLVAAFVRLNPDLPEEAGLEDHQFDHVFWPGGFDWEKIKSKCDRFYFVHGSDDPLCPIEWAREACDRVGGEFISIEHGHHLGGASGTTELPQVTLRLKQDKVI